MSGMRTRAALSAVTKQLRKGGRPYRRDLSGSSVASISKEVTAGLERGQSTSPARTGSNKLLGVAAALRAAHDPSAPVEANIFTEFALDGRVAIVTGANGGLGLEMALALAEAGAHVFGIDLPSSPSGDFEASAAYAKRLGSLISYRQCDVTDQAAIDALCASVGGERGRLDVCVAAAGILGTEVPVLEYDAAQFRRIMEVNCNGVFFTSQAAAKQMARFGNGGSVIMIASMSGSLVNRDHRWIAYNVSKSAVLQMARSMACELGVPHKIRVNSISPGHIATSMTNVFLEKRPDLAKKWSAGNPLGRLGLVHEVRGVTTWLASDASTYCTGSDILISGGHHAW